MPYCVEPIVKSPLKGKNCLPVGRRLYPNLLLPLKMVRFNLVDTIVDTN